MGNGKLQMTFSSQMAQVVISKERNRVEVTVVSVAFLVAVSRSVSRPIKKPQSGKIREVSGKVSGKSNNITKGWAQE